MSKSAFGTIRRLPSGRYQARVRVRGQQATVGTYPTRREAANALARAGAQSVGDKTWDRAGSRQKVSEFVEQWWSTRAGHRASTRARDRLIVDHDLLPFFGAMALADIHSGDVAAWVALLSSRTAPSSVRRCFTVLDQVLDTAVDRGLLWANPAHHARLPRLDRTEMRFLTPVQLERVVASTAPEAGQQLGSVLALRSSEAKHPREGRGRNEQPHLDFGACRSFVPGERLNRGPADFETVGIDKRERRRPVERLEIGESVVDATIAVAFVDLDVSAGMPTAEETTKPCGPGR